MITQDSWRNRISFIGFRDREFLVILGVHGCSVWDFLISLRNWKNRVTEVLVRVRFLILHTMSGGSPVGGGGFMRQRHSQGYSSSGDELEDDACSRPRPSSPPCLLRGRTWIEILENFLWLASAAFIIYFGDRHSNLIYLLLHDDRIRRYLSTLLITLPKEENFTSFHLWQMHAHYLIWEF